MTAPLRFPASSARAELRTNVALLCDLLVDPTSTKDLVREHAARARQLHVESGAADPVLELLLRNLVADLSRAAPDFRYYASQLTLVADRL